MLSLQLPLLLHLLCLTINPTTFHQFNFSFPLVFIIGAQKRKAKVLAAAGSAAVEDLMKTTAKKDEELKALERQQAEFQASVSELRRMGQEIEEQVV